MKKPRRNNKGCLYWLFIGCWLEPTIWLFKIIYWLCIGWWVKLFSNEAVLTGCITIFAIALLLGAIITYWPVAVGIAVIYIICLCFVHKKRYRNVDFDNMDGYQFEQFCADLLKDNGFTKVSVTKGSGDHGIDVLASKNGVKYAFQCKCYSNNVGNKAVQEAHAGKTIYDADVAAVITNREFTAQAKSEALKLGVQLWDRSDILRLVRVAGKDKREKPEKPADDLLISSGILMQSKSEEAIAEKVKVEQSISGKSDSVHSTNERARQKDGQDKEDGRHIFKPADVEVPVVFPTQVKINTTRHKGTEFSSGTMFKENKEGVGFGSSQIPIQVPGDFSGCETDSINSGRDESARCEEIAASEEKTDKDMQTSERKFEEQKNEKLDISDDQGNDQNQCLKWRSHPSQAEIDEDITSGYTGMKGTSDADWSEYIYPPLNLLKKEDNADIEQEQEIRQAATNLQQTLNSYGVYAQVTSVKRGPTVTRYELVPEQGVRLSRIVKLSDEIKLSLMVADIRIEAPIPGKAAIGIEVPNSENSIVALRDLLESEEFREHPSKLAFAAGKDIEGKIVISDIAQMPHLLIGGDTGSGKSVCVDAIIMSILYKASPDEVKLILIDSKEIGLSMYNGIPHLFFPVVTDSKMAEGALDWGVAEMTDRYNKFLEIGARDLKDYNQKIEALDGAEFTNKPAKLPQIVIIIDEFADMMLTQSWKIEDAICTLGRKGHIVGMHMVVATRRLSRNVVTDLIETNIPSRIAFSVSTKAESNMILGVEGAEKLLGNGDMLFRPKGIKYPIRVQGTYIAEEEIANVVDCIKSNNVGINVMRKTIPSANDIENPDALFEEAGKLIIEKDKASIGMLQRVFKIGFNRAARIMDQLADAGVVGPEEGTKPRKVLMSAEQFEDYLEENR